MNWRTLTSALKDVIVFENNWLDIHRILHIHGSLFYHLFMDNLPRSTLPFDIQNLIDSCHCLPLKYRHVWIEADDYHVRILGRGERWFECPSTCKKNALSARPDISSPHFPLSSQPDNAANQIALSSQPDKTESRIILSVESICDMQLLEL